MKKAAKKTKKQPKQNEYTSPELVEVPPVHTVHDPGQRMGTIRQKRGTPYNTALDTDGFSMQICCKCFTQASKGACSGHHSEQYLRLDRAERALNEGCGLAFDVGMQLGAIQGLLKALLDAARPATKASVTGVPTPGFVAILPSELLAQVHQMHAALSDPPKIR